MGDRLMLVGKEFSNKDFVIETVVMHDHISQLGASSLVHLHVVRGPLAVRDMTVFNTNLWNGYIIEPEDHTLRVLLDIHLARHRPETPIGA